MARWQGDAPDRLRDAAMAQFAARGFDGTTVADIAAAAGLTERTFFRHFADKREVLFQGQEQFEGAFLDGLAATQGTDPMRLVAGALVGAAGFFPDERRELSRGRQRVIDSHLAFRERELSKLAALAALLATAVAERGVDPVSAALAAEAGVAVFRVAFATWLADGETRGFVEIQDDLLERLRNLTSSDVSAAPASR